MKKIINVVGIVLAYLFVGIGLIGIAIPVLPTTPFLLVATFLFAKSSPKFHQWFVQTNLYQKYIAQAFYKKEMLRKEKIKMMLVLSILFVIGFIISPIWHAKVVILLIAAGHLFYFLFKIKTVKVQVE